MTISTTEFQAQAVSLSINNEEVSVDLKDGRTIIVPLGWYPRLQHGSVKERRNWQLLGQGEGIHWPDLDEDVSVRNLLAGQPSGESQRSFQAWLEKRTKPRKNR